MMRLALLFTTLSASAASNSVAIYTQPGATGRGIGDCSDEAANLASIVQNLVNTDSNFAGLSIDTRITTFGQSNLVEILNANKFFFMTDMEQAAAGWTASSQAKLKAWVEAGGIMVMTGTYGRTDSDFLNAAFGWDTSFVSCSTVTITSAATGTPFEGGVSTVACPSATSHLNCGSKACTAIYGTTTKAAVATFLEGSGMVVYVGYDYYNTGFATSWNGGPTHSSCSSRTQPYVTDILPAALKYASAAADRVAAGGSASGDPHINLPHGGKADFRGEHKTLYNFLSAKDLSLNVMTELADFELHAADNPRHKDVHGSFLTQAHVVARTNTGKTVRVSYWAAKIGKNNVGWANATVDSEPAFSIGPHQKKEFDDVGLSMGYSSLHLTNPEFEIVITPKQFCPEGSAWCAFMERNVKGLDTRLDVQIKPRVAEAAFALPPHGIIGQGWDGDGKAIDGEQDTFPTSGEFTTYAQAGGAIEGMPRDYKVASTYATDFKYSRFDAKSAEPRNVAKLVAAGLLNTPKANYGGGVVGASENTEEKM